MTILKEKLESSLLNLAKLHKQEYNKKPEQKTYLLNNTRIKLRDKGCYGGTDHDWKVIRKPAEHKSGLHESECRVCGIKIVYDDSD